MSRYNLTSRYNVVFSVRFLIGAVGGFAGAMVCMRYAFATVGGDESAVVLSIEPFAATLFFFGKFRLRPFREFLKGLRVAVPGWDWGRDIATSVLVSGVATGVWLGTMAVLSARELIPALGGPGFWVLAAVLLAATWALSWALCKPLGLFPPPLRPGWGE